MSQGHRIPLPLKLACTAFVAVLVPFYWITYSPWNFLFFCDVALLITLAALWTENPRLMSLPAVGITLPQMLWVFDFLTGSRITGMTGYMFDPKYSLFVRGLSGFHGWLPFLLIWGVWRLGYDRRAFAGWTVIGTTILLASYFLAPAPPASIEHPDFAVNLNYVHGLSDKVPQTWMPSWLWLTIFLVGFPVLFYLPAHLIFRAWFPVAAIYTPSGTAPTLQAEVLTVGASTPGSPPP